MRPRTVVVTLLVAAAAFVAGHTVALEAGAALAVLAALAGAVVLHRLDERRVGRFAERVERAAARGGIGPAEVEDSPAWRRVAVAVDRLAAGGRDARRERGRPWRRQLVDSLAQPALLFSPEGRLVCANEAARQLLGIPPDGEGLTVVQAVGSAALAEAVREVREAGHPVTVDLEHGAHHLRASVSQVGDQMLLIVTDRTRELRVEEVRRNFVVNASHELKTPVTSIQTLTEALQVALHRDPDRVAPLAARLGDEAERLTRLVRDLLDLRRLEERGPLERAPVDLAELARVVVDELRPRADDAGVTLTVEAPDPAIVAGVPGDLEVVVKNLVANAIQYNRPGGSVVVTIAPCDGHQTVRVRDTGIGIPQQDLVRIFERFYRVDTARSRATGGTGLGLSIVRHAVEGHGGRVEVDSQLGEGSTFTVRLPVGTRD